jgi:hypothetical protein
MTGITHRNIHSISPACRECVSDLQSVKARGICLGNGGWNLWLSVHPWWSISLLPRAEAELAGGGLGKGRAVCPRDEPDAPPPVHFGRRRWRRTRRGFVVGMVRCADGWPGLAVVDRPGGAGRGGEGGLDDGVAPAVKGIVVRRIAPRGGRLSDGGRRRSRGRGWLRGGGWQR